jgi:glutathione S-transferase
MKSSGDLKKLEEGVAINVGKDLDWLNSELEGKKFLAGNNVTAADTMCLFSIQFIFARDLCAGRKAVEWKNVERWMRDCEGTESWQRPVRKTGHEM